MIVGIDEVGRGSWAGPLVAGAVILHTSIDRLNDSKKLSPNTRGLLAKKIYQYGEVGLGWVTAAEVDSLGLTESVRTAMERALSQLKNFDKVIIDGNYNYLSNFVNSVAVVKADSKIAEVSAASIVAKVARDLYMCQLAKNYPNYGFEKNVGYGTKQHQAALKIYGLTSEHRLSFNPIKVYL